MIRRLANLARVLWRALRLSAALAVAGADYLLTLRVMGQSRSIPAKARWMQRQSRRLLRVLAVEPVYQGEPPPEGVLVSNHLSYLDILVLGARQPLVFISKHEVIHWPVFGALARRAGTLFIRRGVRTDVARIAKETPRIVHAGVPLAFFPEGTSSDGESVLPFHSPLLNPAVRHQWPVTPAAIRYSLAPEDGDPREAVAYWGEMTFGTHLLGLMEKRRIDVLVQYGEPEAPGEDREELANRLHRRVARFNRRNPHTTNRSQGLLKFETIDAFENPD
jgi:1-acyl-sn-glycerol-3-phosphate acyltransferase